jgi:hypothetical protein
MREKAHKKWCSFWGRLLESSRKVKLVGFCLVLLFVFSLIQVLEKVEVEFISSGSHQNAVEEEQKLNSEGLPQNKQQSPHPSFISRQELYEVLAEEQVLAEKQRNVEGTILAGVVPHHLVAGSMITDLLAALVPQEPELIVIIGPNHHNLGGRTITGFADWQTPEGLVQTEDNLVQALLKKKVAVQDEQVLSKEHSIGSLIPLIKHYLPQAKVVPIIYHHDVTIEEVDKLLAVLDPLLAEEKSVLLASVDFSHYLTRKEAEEKDSLTLRVMNNFDYPTLFHLGNDHLDSPASLATIFRFAEMKELREFQLLANTNSGVILQNDFIETTSYFTLVFLKSNQS